MRKFLSIYGLLTVLVLSGCAKQEPKKIAEPVQGVTDAEILIGSSAALSGHASFLGTQYIHGSEGYFNEVNNQGGVNGRKIRLISYDDQYDPPQTVANTQTLINQDHVFALFDYVGTPTSVKIIDMVNESKIPALGFFTGAESLRTPLRPYMFHVRDSYYAEAEGAIAYFVDKLGLKNIAVMYQDDAFGQAVLTGVQLALKRRSLEPVATATFKRGSMEVEPALEIIRPSNAQVVIMVGTYSPLARFIKISHDAEYKPFFHTVSFVGSLAYGKEIVEIQKIDPSQLENISITQVVPSPLSQELPGIQEYLTNFKKYHPDDPPSDVALEGYVNAKVLVKALRDAGPHLTRESFISAMEALKNFNVGIGKSVSYSAVDHQGLSGVYYAKVTSEGSFKQFDPWGSVAQD